MKIDELNSALSAKKNEYKMLSESLLEMVERKSSNSSVDALKEAMESTMDDIYEISEQIRCEEINKRAHKTKDAIDDMEKRSFYDSIEKQENCINEENPAIARETLQENYGYLYEHLCSAQYLARKIGDKLLEDEIKDIRVNVGDTLLRFHGYLK